MTLTVGFGGVYTCAVQKKQGKGTVFVPLKASGGKPQAARKWAHEMGHAMGLPHTPCEEKYKDNLMMSGNCKLANPDRIDLNANQIVQIAKQYEVGGPVSCKDKNPDAF